LIVLLQKVTVGLRPDAPNKEIPANAVGPTNWCAYSLWRQLAGEKEIEFSQVIQVLWPNKSEFLKRSVQFRFGDQKGHNVLVNIAGFPIGQAGEITVNMWLERESQRIGDIHSWTIEVEHKPHDPNSEKIEAFT